jgi:WD40 repeat protein
MLLAAMISLVSACGSRGETPEPRLVPTRTRAPAFAATTAPTPKPIATSTSGLTLQNAAQLDRVFQIEEPLPQHIYTAGRDRLVLFGMRNFELVDADTLDLLARTPVQVSDLEAGIFWYAASTDGRRGAIMQSDGKVDIYDLESSRVIQSFRVLPPSTEIVSDIALTADGSELVVVSRGALSRLRLSDGSRTDRGVIFPPTAQAIRFAEDASRVAVALTTGEVVIAQTLKDAPAVTLTLPFTRASIVHFDFDPTGTFFAASSEEGLAVWDLSDAAPRLIKIFTELGAPVQPHLERSGRFIAINLSPMVLVYDLKEDEPYAQFRLAGNLPVWSVNFDPSGQRMFLAGSGELASFDIENRRALRSVTRLPLTRSAFAADGQTLFTWSGAYLSNKVIIFDTLTWEVRARLQHPAPVLSVMPDRTGRYVATLMLGRSIAVWHALSGDLVSQIGDPLTDTTRLMLCFTPDGQGLVYLDDRRVVIHDLNADRRKESFTLPFVPVGISRCDNAKGWFAVADKQTIRVLTLGGDLIATIKESASQDDIALDLSRDGSKLVVLTNDQLAFWDVTAQRRLRTVRLSRELRDVAFSPDRGRFALNFGDRIEIVNVTDGERVTLRLPTDSSAVVLFPSDPRVVVTLAMLPSSKTADQPIGRRIFTAGEVGIWDARTGNLIRKIASPQPLASGSISEDGTLIVTTTSDNAMLVWGMP